MGILQYFWQFLGIGIWMAAGLFLQSQGYFVSDAIQFRVSPDVVITGGTLMWAVYMLVGIVLLILTLKQVVRNLITTTR